ncbi:hypothetical protein [Sphingomonas sp. BK345]|uniref:hypothetical protein n=1 Tax=Sphingomonas sp. BK345 TaxID=2586980 RepID=UPI00160C974A|nr:hypothetical protein [Sphingomonas sp. BK345]MBB3475854.1 hypothetical protein [Sphingomonas sp. BK345]
MDDLARIADGLAELTNRFFDAGVHGLALRPEDASRFTGHALESRDIIDQALGAGNAFSGSIAKAMTEDPHSLLGGPSKAAVIDVLEVVRRASAAIDRRNPNYHAIEAISELSRQIGDHAFELHMIEEDNPNATNVRIEGTSIHALIIEVRALIAEHLGRSSPYYTGVPAFWTGPKGQPRTPNATELSDVSAILAAAIRHLRRPRAITLPPKVQTGTIYVDPSIIEQIATLPTTNFDFSRLAELCRSLNVTAAANAHMATAMLLRAIIDHVPPIFGFKTFEVVAAQAPGTHTFKQQLGILQNSMRKATDACLHTPIGKKRDLPTAVAVDFRSPLEALLQHIIRIAG